MIKEDSKNIKLLIKDRKNEIDAWLKKLISFPSENRYPDGFEADAQNFIENECKKNGFDVYTFLPTEIKGIELHKDWLKGRNYQNNRKNVVAKWKGNSGAKSVLLSGHIDVAPFEPDNWKETRPFIPKIKQGKLYGRGSADMKGGLAALFWAVKILKEIGFVPGGDIIFESLVDEEFAGGNGTLAARLKGYNTDFAIITEPTRMEVCLACPGAILGEIIIKGNAGMPYMGLPIQNPIDGAAKVIQLFEKWIQHWRNINSHELFLEKDNELNYLLWDISTQVSDEFIQMGTPANVKVSWIVWVHPGTTEEAFFKEFEAFWDKNIKKDKELSNFKFDIRQTFHFVKPWQTEKESSGVKEIIKVYSDYMEIKPKVTAATFSCDMAIYGDTGKMPVILLGPRGDNLHGSDEWVLLEDIYSLIGIFILFIKNWCK